MANKPFAFGLLVGRFQSLHVGHADMIQKALSICERVGVFISSAQESGTRHNPFDYALRKRLLDAVFPGQLAIQPLTDLGRGNCASWGQYVLEQAVEQFAALPDLTVSGKEARRVSWFDEGEGARVAELIIPKTANVSATDLRRLIAADDRAAWQRFTPPAIHGLYDEMRHKVLLSLSNTQTASR